MKKNDDSSPIVDIWYHGLSLFGVKFPSLLAQTILSYI